MDRRDFLKFSARSGKMMGIATFLSSMGISCSNQKLFADVDKIGSTALRHIAETKGNKKRGFELLNKIQRHYGDN